MISKYRPICPDCEGHVDKGAPGRFTCIKCGKTWDEEKILWRLEKR